MAYAYKKGELKDADVSAEVKELADSMTLKQLKDFASTKHDGLPEVAENITPAAMGGIGPVVLPMAGQVGSGDVPAGKGDAEEEYKKKKRKMKHLKTFESFVNEYSTIVDTNKMLKALKKAIKAADSFEAIGDELDDLDYKNDYKWEFVEDFKGVDVGGHPAYIITYLQGTQHAISDPDFWKNSSGIEDKVGDLAIGWILGK